MPTLSKSQADQLQNKVLSCGQGIKIDKAFFADKEAKTKNKRGGSLDSLGSTLGHEVRGKPSTIKKDALDGLKSNDWIGSEDDFQIAVAKLLDSHNLDWFHCPNGGKRHVSVATKLKKMGVKAGIPDVIILNKPFGGDGLCIELKVGKNKMTDTQLDWETRFHKNDWLYFLAYGIEDVNRILSRNYGI